MHIGLCMYCLQQQRSAVAVGFSTKSIGWLTFISWSQIDILCITVGSNGQIFFFFLRAYFITNTLLTRLLESMSITPTVGEIETWLLAAFGWITVSHELLVNITCWTLFLWGQVKQTNWIVCTWKIIDNFATSIKNVNQELGS